MANAYLDAYRAAGTKAPIAGGSSTGSDNPYLKSYRTTQLPGVMDTFNKQKADQQTSQKLKAQQDADKKKRDEANSPVGFLRGLASGVADFISQASKPVGQGGVNVVANASQSVEQALNQQKKQATKQIKAGQPLSTVIPASGIGVLDKITGASDFAGKAGNTLAAIPALSGAILAKPGSKTRKDLEQAAATNVKKSFISPDVANPKKGANPLDTTAKFAGEFAGAGASAAGFIGVPEAKGIQLITKAATDAGLSDIGKSVFTKAVEGAQKKAGRDLTQPELTKLAEQTKKVIPEPKTPVINAQISEDLKSVPGINPEIKTVKPADLKLGQDTIDAAGINPSRVSQYVQDIKEGKPIEPLVVTKDKTGQLFVQDGKHRLEAAQQAGVKDIPVVERAVKTGKKDLKTAIDARIYETHPHLFHAEATGKVFNETGTGTIPKLHVDDVKKYFGNKENLPSIYKRTTGERNIDQLAQQAGYDDVDTFVEHIQQELRTRGDAREATQKLAEMRKDPQIIADAQKALDEDNARYGGTQEVTPSEKDLRDYNKSRGDNVKPLKNKPSLTTDEIDTGIKGNRNVKGDTPSGNALRIAIENKLDTGKDIAEYKGINIEDQKQKLIKLLENDHQRAIDIIDGKANPPSDLKAQFVHQALEEEAKITGDGELLQKLKKSPINRELSESAQNLRIAAERDPNSPVELMRQIEDAKRLAIEKRGGSIKKTVNDIGKKVDAATPKVKKEDWASFVESLKC